MAILSFTKADVLRSQNLENERWYSWIIKSITGPTPSKDKQSYNFKVVFSLIDHSTDLDGKEVERTFNSKAHSMWLPLIAAAKGVPPDQLDKNAFQIDADELLSKKVDGKYTLDTYEGMLVAHVETYLPYKSVAGSAPPF